MDVTLALLMGAVVLGAGGVGAFVGRATGKGHGRQPQADDVVDDPVGGLSPDLGSPLTPRSPEILAHASVAALRAGLIVLDAADEPVLANPAARRMGLLRPSGSRGEAVTHAVLRTLAGQVRRSGQRCDTELDLPTIGDSASDRPPLGVRVSVVTLGGGYVAIEVEDVTEAHRVARVRRDFVDNVSHELKTPVGALQLLAEALVDALDSGADKDTGDGAGGMADVAAARRFAERIQHESKRMSRLVSELLELSRLQGAEPLPHPEPVAVNRIVNEVLDRTRTGAAAKDITIDVHVPGELTVYGNESQLVMAVANLIDNAVAYSPEHTRVTVTATASDEDTIDIAVADEGIGIAADDLDRIFERFYRADPARSRATGGTGLGLAIVKHIATNHGGRVTVSSVPGAGSTFTVRLPARPPAATTPAPAAAELHSGSPGGHHTTPTDGGTGGERRAGTAGPAPAAVPAQPQQLSTS